MCPAADPTILLRSWNGGASGPSSTPRGPRRTTLGTRTLEQLWQDSAWWLLKAAALGVVFAVDGQAALHLVAAQPLVVGALAGWVLGDAGLGLVVGAYLQLVWAYGPPRGRTPGADAASGTIAAVVVANAFAPRVSHGDGHLALALFVAAGVAWLGGRGEAVRWRINARIGQRALERIRDRRPPALGRAHAAAVALAGARGGLTALIGSSVGLSGGALLINLFARMDFGAAFALIPLLGLATFVLGVVKVRRAELTGFAAGLAAALLVGLKFGIT